VTPRWMGALSAAAAFAVLAFFLGQWQWDRHQERVVRADRVAAHYDAAPRPLTQVLSSRAPLPRAREWTRVSAQGRYAGRPLLVRNRPLRGTYGYEVLVPLALGDGTALLVDRGWVPNAESAQSRPEVPPAPAGTVTVTGWLRPSEPSLAREMPPGQLASINLLEAEREAGRELLGGYLVLGGEEAAGGGTGSRPAPLERPDTGLGSHQAYAIQWWGSMPVGFVLVFFGVRREHRTGQGGGSAAQRPRRQRIWDEEDA
jgi:cytochrome oxidase assembly protein ShyY1